MIHQLLNLTRPMFWLDCETTGTDVKTDRIVELGFEQWTAEGMVKEWRSLINPGVPIPAESTKVHDITDDQLRACTKCAYYKEAHPVAVSDVTMQYCEQFHPVPHFKQLAPNLALGLVNCDFGGKNVRFDLRILAAEFARAGVEWGYVGARIVDAERLEQIAVPRTLSHLHEKYTGHKHDDAHGALSDVRASVTVVVHQLQAHPTLPRDLDQLHALQWPGFIDGDGKFRFNDGVACFGGWGKYANKPMHKVPVAYYDFILGADFSADVKALARDAKLGKFPEGK